MSKAVYFFSWVTKTAWLSVLFPSAFIVFLLVFFVIAITYGGYPNSTSIESWREFFTQSALAGDDEWKNAGTYISIFIRYVFYIFVPVIVFFRIITSKVVETLFKNHIADPCEAYLNRKLFTPFRLWHSKLSATSQRSIHWGFMITLISIFVLFLATITVKSENNDFERQVLIKDVPEKSDHIILRLPDGEILSGKAEFKINGDEIVLNFNNVDSNP